jgi:ribonuclease HI
LELFGIREAADVLLSQGFTGRSIAFHVDNQAALQSLNGNDITMNCARLAREALNKLGTNNRVHLDWCKAHVGVLGKKIADYMAKARGRSSVPIMGIIVKPAMCLVKRELKELMNKKWAA